MESRNEQGGEMAMARKRRRMPLIVRFLIALTLLLSAMAGIGIALTLSGEDPGAATMRQDLLAWMARRLTPPLRQGLPEQELRRRLLEYTGSGVFDVLVLRGPEGQRIAIGDSDTSGTWLDTPLAMAGWRLFGHLRSSPTDAGNSRVAPYLVLFLATLLLVVWLVRRFFDAPLRQLIREVDGIGTGQRRAPLRVDGGEEFRSLARFINGLLSHCDGQRNSLQQALVNVRDSRERLEQTVRERTEALEQTARALRRRELLLQEYAEVTSQRIDARGRIRELMRLACRMLSLQYGMVVGRRGEQLVIIERYPLGRQLPLPDIGFIVEVVAAGRPLARTGSGGDEEPEVDSEAAPAAFVALPLTVLDKHEFILLIAGQTSAQSAFLREDIGLLALFRDWIAATLTNEAQERLIHRQKERAQVTLESITEAVVTTDQLGIVDYMNPVAEMLTGIAAHEALGRHSNEILRLYSESRGEPVADPVARCLDLKRAVVLAEDLLLRGSDGREYAVEGSFAPIRDRRGELAGSVVVLHDVSQAREMAQRLSYHATHDALTGLCNRREFESRLTQAMDSARNAQRRHALLYMDLDQFKIVNDTSGHTAGDSLLKQVADELQRYIDEDDTLARLGGDEFGVLLLDCDIERAMLVAERLLEAIRNFRFTWRHRTFEIGISIGLVPLDQNVGHLSQVMSAADTACYAAKNEGRNRIHLYEADDAAVTHHRGMMEWAVTINTALQLNRFELYRQPIRALNPGTVTHHHYEILLRMRREDGSLVEPGHFIPAAERFDLMPAVDRWVIRHVCDYLARNQEDDEARYSVNLSGASVDDESLLDFITNILIEYDTDPSRLCFEITETEAISSLHRAIELVRELRAIGCRFSLDDFGAGFSSFSYLKNFPLDYLKIDGAFISDMLGDPVDQAMVKAINDVGHTMGIETIAEYVESAEIAELLREIGVDYAQGYWVARPERLIVEPAMHGARKEIAIGSGRFQD